MRAKVQITIEWELASPDDYPPDTVNSWLEAASYDIENCIGLAVKSELDGIVSDFDLSIVYGTPELEGETESESFVRSEDLDEEA